MAVETIAKYTGLSVADIKKTLMTAVYGIVGLMSGDAAGTMLRGSNAPS